MPAAYYSAKLYPFMDKVLALISKADTAFYLTGGTALGRHYLHHRYSDDLDLFVNGAAEADFRAQVNKALAALRRGGITLETGTAADTFVRILARTGSITTANITTSKIINGAGKHEGIANGGETTLKIDFINDVTFHYGDFQEAPFYPRIDHWRNILSNKLCALSRREPKDIADILSIARRFSFSWPDIFSEARQKDLWVEPLEISRMIQEFPVELLAAVKWTQPFDPGVFAADLKAMDMDIFHGRDNSIKC